jgi:hypothetical protein
MRYARAPAEPGEATCAVHRSPRSVAAEEGIPELRLPPRSAAQRAVIYVGPVPLAAWQPRLYIAIMRAVIR